MSTSYIAKDLERLEEIYYRHHGVNDGRYLEFCEKNVLLLKKDLLDAGDKVQLLESNPVKEAQTTQRVALWE